MGVEEDWILFLEKNPQYYQLTQGNFFMQFLETISKGMRSFDEMRKLFPYIEDKDMQDIIDVLLTLKLVSKIKTGSKMYYSIAPEGKRLMKQYMKTKRFYST